MTHTRHTFDGQRTNLWGGPPVLANLSFKSTSNQTQNNLRVSCVRHVYVCVMCICVCHVYVRVMGNVCVCHVYVCVMCVNGPGVQELKKYRIPARCRPPVRPPVCSLSLARRSFVSQSRIGQICDFLCKGFESRTRQSFQRNMSCVRAKQTSQLSRKPNSIFCV